MKTSIVLLLSDILPRKRKIFHKIVKNKIFKNQNTEDVFKHLKKIGIDGFELLLPQYANTTDADVQEIKKLSSKSKFPVLSVHQALRFLTATKITEITRLFEIAAMLDAKVIVLHMNSAKKQIFDKEYIQALHKLEKKHKIKVTFENMEKHVGSILYGHRWHAAKFSDVIKRNDFHITLDVVHLAHSGGNIIDFFHVNKERIANVHMSDYKKHLLNSSLRPMRYKHMPLGDGELPLGEFISLLQQEKYPGLLTLELHADLSGVERSMSLVNTYK